MTKTTDANMDDRLCEVSDILTTVRSIEDSLGCAESCETPADFDGNIDDAIATTKSLLAALRELRED